jgi:hypothetical protein
VGGGGRRKGVARGEGKKGESGKGERSEETGAVSCLTLSAQCPRYPSARRCGLAATEALANRISISISMCKYSYLYIDIDLDV